MKHRTGYIYKRGTTWYCQYRIDGKRFRVALKNLDGSAVTTADEAATARQHLMAPLTVADRAEALQAVAAKLGDTQAQLAAIEDKANPGVTIADAWGEFCASTHRPDSGNDTMRMYVGQWRHFAHWLQGAHPDATRMRDVTPEIGTEYAKHLLAGNGSPNTYNKHLNLLTMVYRVLEKESKAANPFAQITRKRVIVESRRELTTEELRKVCTHATGEMRTLFAIGIYTGLRLKDAATLRWGEVDMGRGIIRRVPSKTARHHPAPVQIPIHPALLGLFLETPVNNRVGDVLPGLANRYRTTNRYLIELIQKVFTDCGIQVHRPASGPRKKAVVDVGFHSLRHSFVSLCAEAGVPMAITQSLVGHGNPAMTNHYTHIGAAASVNAVAKLPAMLPALPTLA